MTSEDLVNWSYPRTVFYPHEADLPDFDHVCAFRYGNMFLMLNGVMDGDDSGRKEVQFASSPDGLTWTPFENRQAYMPRGEKGGWEGGAVLPSVAPVLQGEKMLFYYRGGTLGQHEWGEGEGGIGLATAKLDRFVEQRAGAETGYLLTKEFILEGKTLVLNFVSDRRPYRQPRLRVEIVKHPAMGEHWRFREACEGYRLDDCDPLKGDRTEVAVTWNGKADLSALAGQPVYLRFELQHMGLFSFRVVP